MPVHDWTKVDVGAFHDFHIAWIAAIRTSLNTRLLPDSYYALVEQSADMIDPDIGNEHDFYLGKQRRVAIRHRSGDHLVAVVEVLSAANNRKRREFRRYVEKTVAMLQQGIQLLVLDLFVSNVGNSRGIHDAIWSELGKGDCQMPPDQPLTMASYAVAEGVTAYVEPVAVGDVLKDMPLFLAEEEYIAVPLEATYLASWHGVPKHLQRALERSNLGDVPTD